MPSTQIETHPLSLAPAIEPGHRSQVGRDSQADRLVNLALDRATLFCGPDRTAFAHLLVSTHRETHAIGSTTFKEWLAHCHHTEYGRSPTNQALKEALGVLEGEARFGGHVHPVFVRYAFHEGQIYLDLGRPDWEVIEVSPTGWHLLAESPVHFHRPNTLRPLPVPVTGGQMNELLGVINVSEDAWPLVSGFIVGCLEPSGPYPVLNLHGEHGSAKTTTARILKSVIDPSTGIVRSAPRTEIDLLIGAMNNRVPLFDNISDLSKDMSDSLCRLSTGGAFGKRKLYSDSDEVVLEARRPVILTGINEVATRPDLLDRTLVVEAPVIPEEQRRTEREVMASFDEMHARVLGAALAATSLALANRDTVRLERTPRMADFARWVVAAEPALGLEPGSFMKAYEKNRDEASRDVMDSSPVAQSVLGLLTHYPTWTGTMKALLAELSNRVDPDTFRSREWPRSPKGLGGILRRLSPGLRNAGVGVTIRAPGRDGVVVTLQSIEQAAGPGSNDLDRGRAESSPRSPASPDRAGGETPGERPAAPTFTTDSSGSQREERAGESREHGEDGSRAGSDPADAPTATVATALTERGQARYIDLCESDPGAALELREVLQAANNGENRAMKRLESLLDGVTEDRAGAADTGSTEDTDDEDDSWLSAGEL